MASSHGPRRSADLLQRLVAAGRLEPPDLHPDRGTFFSENISGSASTIFLIGARRDMYTRIYDFDTSGEDDLLEYSYLITAASGQARALPAEDWRLQPAVTDGLIDRSKPHVGPDPSVGVAVRAALARADLPNGISGVREALAPYERLVA